MPRGIVLLTGELSNDSLFKLDMSIPAPGGRVKGKAVGQL